MQTYTPCLEVERSPCVSLTNPAAARHRPGGAASQSGAMQRVHDHAMAETGDLATREWRDQTQNMHAVKPKRAASSNSCVLVGHCPAP
jgi:hypothetical protein